MKFQFVFALSLTICLQHLAGAADIPKDVIPNLLNGLTWRGPGVTMEDLSGKTVAIVNYVTWCPKCNAWSPELFDQIRKAAAGEPVIVVAICTDEETTPGSVYVSQRNFLSPNILHAYHPQGSQRIGEGNGLFTGVVIGPNGNVTWKGNLGSYYDRPEGKEFSIARKINEAKNRGSFRIVANDMPVEVLRVLWPMELGQVVSGRDINRVKGKLSPVSRELLDAAVDDFVEKQLEQIQKLQEGEIPEQILAFQKAEQLSKTYPATDPGKEAKQYYIQKNRDTEFRREVAALREFDKLSDKLTSATTGRRESMLAGFSKRFEETYAASLANDRLAREQGERISSEDATSITE